MKLIKHMTLSLALITLMGFSFIKEAKADYYMVYVKYTCPPLKAGGPVRYLTATYKKKSLARARQALNAFRSIPRYRNCWIRLVRE